MKPSAASARGSYTTQVLPGPCSAPGATLGAQDPKVSTARASVPLGASSLGDKLAPARETRRQTEPGGGFPEPGSGGGLRIHSGAAFQAEGSGRRDRGRREPVGTSPRAAELPLPHVTASARPGQRFPSWPS